MSNEVTVLDLIERAAKLDPAHPAIVAGERVINHGELLDQSRRIGGALATATQKAAVALFFPMSPEFVAAYYGTLFAAKEALPLNLLLPPEELKFIIQDADADTIVAPTEFVARLAPLGLKVLDYAQLAASAPAPLPARPKPDDVCTLLYTSGTTGKPKGVMLTHRNLATNTDGAIEAMQLAPGYRVLACLPSFHTFAITATMLAPLCAAGSIATLPKFDPEAVLKAASTLRCDTLMMVPSMYRLVTRMQQRKPMDMKHLRLAISGGEALPSEVRDSFEKTFGLPLLEGYGQTETSPVVSFNLPWANQPGTVGKPIRDVVVQITDTETLKALPPDTTGEVWVRGPNIMKGYRNRPEETAAAITQDGWLRTGDMGELTPQGYLRITGRLREMVKVAGEMVFPAEVENALLHHPAVAEAGVTGVKDERKGEALKAFVVLKADQKATEDEILHYCRANLASYKVPRSVEFRNELPKGPTGKVMRRLLK